MTSPNDLALAGFTPGGLRFLWDSTTLGAFKTCPRYYQYRYVDGWGNNHESAHLRFGQEFHRTLQDYHICRAADMPHPEALLDTITGLHRRVWNWHPDPTTRAGRYKNATTVTELVIDYLDTFGANDPVTTWILYDGSPAVELSFRFEIDSTITDPTTCLTYPITLTGHLDRVGVFNDDLWVLDYKTTTTTLSSNYFAQYSPSNQMSLYTIAGKIALNQPIKGVIIDAAQVLLEKPHAFQRGFATRTEAELNEWLRDLTHYVHAAAEMTCANYFPCNDTSCGTYGGCTFRDICSRHPDIRETYLRANFTNLPPDQRWIPGADRNK